MRVLALISLLLLGACGFKPLYEAGGSTAAMRETLAAIEIAPIKDRIGQIMHNRLLDRLGTAGTPQYRLEITLEQSTEKYGTRPDAATTQEQITLRAHVRLMPYSGEEPLFEETLRARTSYDIVLSDFASVSQREDSARRLVLELAERIHRRLAIQFSKTE
jgi:LPS-assembly lipoprotein